MTRTKPSATVLALIAAVEKHDVTASPTQLERWRQRAWLPATGVWLDPTSSELRPEIVQRAVELAKASRSGHSISWVGWVFWAIDDTADSAQRLRAALLEALKRPFEQAGVGQVPRGDSDEAFQAREEAAARLLENRRFPRRDLDGILRSYAAAADYELPPSPSDSMPNPLHRALVEPATRLMLGGASDVGFEVLMEAWENASPEASETIERIRALQYEAELAGGDLMAQSPLADGLHGLLRAVEGADDRMLCKAVRTCTKASGTLSMLWLRAVHEPEILRKLMDDIMWGQWAGVSGLAPGGVAGEAAVTINTVQYLVNPGWAEDLERYLAFMETLLLAPPSEPTPRTPTTGAS